MEKLIFNSKRMGWGKKLFLIVYAFVFPLSLPTRATISYATIAKGVSLGIASCSALSLSAMVYMTKKLQNKQVFKDNRLAEYYVKHENYLHLFMQSKTEDAQKKKSCIFYLHGIGGHGGRRLHVLIGKERKYLLDCADYIVPCLEFTNYVDHDCAPFFNTDFGQEQDLLTALDALKQFFISNTNTYEKLIIMARSRGGAIAINLVGVLSTQDHYLLKKIGISESERVLILEKLAIGGIILITPLLSVKYALQLECGSFLGSILYPTVFRKITRDLYIPVSSLKPLSMIQKWKNHKISLTVLMATDDEVVGTKYNASFLAAAQQYNGITPYTIYITGGHDSEQSYYHATKVLDEMLFKNN
jgi:hypothetical protein